MWCWICNNIWVVSHFFWLDGEKEITSRQASNRLQYWTKLSQNNINACCKSSLRIQLFKSLLIIKTLPFPQKNNVEVRLDHVCARLSILSMVGWSVGEGRGCSMGILCVRKCQIFQHFLPKIVACFLQTSNPQVLLSDYAAFSYRYF